MLRTMRYFFWLTMYQLTVFYKLKPWQFFMGLAMLPVMFLTSLLLNEENRNALITKGVGWLEESYGQEDTPTPPAFVMKAIKELA